MRHMQTFSQKEFIAERGRRSNAVPRGVAVPLPGSKTYKTPQISDMSNGVISRLSAAPPPDYHLTHSRLTA